MFPQWLGVLSGHERVKRCMKQGFHICRWGYNVGKAHESLLVYLAAHFDLTFCCCALVRELQVSRVPRPRPRDENCRGSPSGSTFARCGKKSDLFLFDRTRQGGNLKAELCEPRCRVLVACHVPTLSPVLEGTMNSSGGGCTCERNGRRGSRVEA